MSDDNMYVIKYDKIITMTEVTEENDYFLQQISK